MRTPGRLKAGNKGAGLAGLGDAGKKSAAAVQRGSKACRGSRISQRAVGDPCKPMKN